jgi:hypothetical protein
LDASVDFSTDEAAMKQVVVMTYGRGSITEANLDDAISKCAEEGIRLVVIPYDSRASMSPHFNPLPTPTDEQR